MHSLEDAFREQDLVMEKALDACLLLKRFRDENHGENWSPQLGETLHPLLEALSSATRELAKATEKVCVIHQHWLDIARNPTAVEMPPGVLSGRMPLERLEMEDNDEP
ncbi:hypothetical protein [Haloferula sargassicola]|uniref:Transposase n=1 Tax=Haloferula sargassicola TaxID=490096 RepID=A0ABP9UND2_9BACT